MLLATTQRAEAGQEGVWHEAAGNRWEAEKHLVRGKQDIPSIPHSTGVIWKYLSE